MIGNCSKTLPQAKTTRPVCRFACCGGTAWHQTGQDRNNIPKAAKEIGTKSHPEVKWNHQNGVGSYRKSIGTLPEPHENARNSLVIAAKHCKLQKNDQACLPFCILRRHRVARECTTSQQYSKSGQGNRCQKSPRSKMKPPKQGGIL